MYAWTEYVYIYIYMQFTRYPDLVSVWMQFKLVFINLDFGRLAGMLIEIYVRHVYNENNDATI